MSTRAACFAAAVCFATAALVAFPSRAAGQAVTYRPPVLAPITDHFRAPAHPFGPGNRGIDYATVPGTSVRAAAPGRVTFAGAVAGRLVVVLIHADRLRSTYDGLATITVAGGDDVGAGVALGTASAHLHFGVRDGTTYLDPELLFAASGDAADAAVVARLVPTSGAPARAATSGAARPFAPADRR